MLQNITWRHISLIWITELWPNRISPIEKISHMMLEGPDMDNSKFEPSFFGYFVDSTLVGVNSGHMCCDGSYRSRGLYVNPEYRGKGIGQVLLNAAIEQARKEKAKIVWSFPRQTSWPTYSAVGFKLLGNWQSTETSDANAKCSMVLVVD